MEKLPIANADLTKKETVNANKEQATNWDVIRANLRELANLQQDQDLDSIFSIALLIH